jgi:hypothetical protein
MTIWITRDSAGSINSGGLERLRVHFRKPVYLVEPLPKEWLKDDALFEYHQSRGPYRFFGWYSEGFPTLSVGKWIGYGESDNPEKELALYIWGKLCEHFQNADFMDWMRLEKEGHCKVQDFLLEIEINLSICSNPKSNAEAPNY